MALYKHMLCNNFVGMVSVGLYCSSCFQQLGTCKLPISSEAGILLVDCPAYVAWTVSCNRVPHFNLAGRSSRRSNVCSLHVALWVCSLCVIPCTLQAL